MSFLVAVVVRLNRDFFISSCSRFQNAEYEVIDDSQEHWWKVKDAMGNVGYIPSNYVKPKALLGLERYE